MFEGIVDLAAHRYWIQSFEDDSLPWPAWQLHFIMSWYREVLEACMFLALPREALPHETMACNMAHGRSCGVPLVCVCIYVYTTYRYVCVCICIYIYSYIYIWICVYVYIIPSP